MEWNPSTLSQAHLEQPQAPLFPGTVVAERFELGEVLGAGGFTIVYRAHDRELGCEVALKILRSDRLSPAVLTRFRREAMVARSLAHPGIVRMLDLALGLPGSAAGACFLVAPDEREGDVRKQLARPAFSRVADLDVSYLPYSALRNHREAIGRFGSGLKGIRAIARSLRGSSF